MTEPSTDDSSPRLDTPPQFIPPVDSAPIARSAELPRPVIRRAGIGAWLVWLVPIAAAVALGVYLRDEARHRGPEIVIRFQDANGIRVDQTPITHRGVSIGKVIAIDLSPDHAEAMVHIQLEKQDADFARQGASFWIVKPEISFESVKGLGTLVSGPYIESNPGDGADAVEFSALGTMPRDENGLHIVLRANRLDRMGAGAPVTFRGLQVGLVEKVALSPYASEVQAQVLIYPRYAPLVRSDSKFWVVAGADVKGGIFSGMEVKLDSLQTLLTGSISFATPEPLRGSLATDQAEFILYTGPKDEWLTWAPRIHLDPEQPAGSATRQSSRLTTPIQP